MNIFFILKKIIGYEEVFTISYRKRRDSSSLLEDSDSEFIYLPIDKDYWYADPILYWREGKIYVFCEMYNRKKCKAGIAVSEVDEDDNLLRPQMIIEEEFHMSFPFVFNYNGVDYMIPETVETGKIKFYKSVRFPHEWELDCEIDMEDCCDCVVVNEADKYHLITSKINRINPLQTKNEIYSLYRSGGKFNIEKIKYVFSNEDEYSYIGRNAGPIFKLDGRWYHPVQISAPYQYGKGIRFDEVIKNNEVFFCEGESYLSDQFRIRNFKRKLLGVHTYGLSEQIEIIDIKFEVYNPMKWIYRSVARWKNKFKIMI